MTCDEADALVLAFLEGVLSLEDRAAFQDHVEACPRCREEVSALTAMTSRMDAWPLEEPSPAFRARIYQALSQAQAEASIRRSRGWAAFGRVAAVFLLAGGGFLAGWLARVRTASRPRTLDSGLALLHQGSEDLRMSGILLASQEHPGDPATAAALLHLANQDPSESARLAAVDALFLYGHLPEVQDGLEASLARQSSPRVQMAMVDLLASLREQRAVEALHRLLEDPRTRPEVARHVEIRLKETRL